MPMIIHKQTRLRIILKNGRRYCGRAEQVSPAFIHLNDEIDGSLHILNVEELSDVQVLGEELRRFSE